MRQKEAGSFGFYSENQGSDFNHFSRGRELPKTKKGCL